MRQILEKNMQQIIQHFTDNDAYTFSCQYYIMQTYPRAEVEYTFFDRNETVYPKVFAELLNEQLGVCLMLLSRKKRLLL